MSGAVHWAAHESPMVWSNPVSVIACGAYAVRGQFRTNGEAVTCPACLRTIVRRRCMAIEDVPGPLPSRCTLTPHVGLHSWERGPEDTVLTHERCAQLRDEEAGMLPVRTPGAALRDAEAESEPGVRPESAGAGESILGRRVIERWPA